MTASHKVVWAEGVFLTQQHFQLWDKLREKQDLISLQTTSPMCRGIVTLRLDLSGLAYGRFDVLSCRAILMDGQWIDFDEAIAGQPLSIDLSQLSASLSHCPIYLAVPNNRHISGLTGYLTKNESDVAWRADYKDIVDDIDPERKNEVIVGTKNIKLLCADQSLDGFSYIQIANLIKQSEQGYSLDENYIPAVTSLASSSLLKSLLKRVRENIDAKRRQLTLRRDQYKGSVSEFGHNDVVHFSLLQVLTTAQTNAQLINEFDFQSPTQLYAFLRQLHASLLPFVITECSSELASFNLFSLSETFYPLEQAVVALLDKVLPAPMKQLQLNKETDNLYSVTSMDSLSLKQHQFILAVDFVSQDVDWIKLFEQHVKLAAREKIAEIVAKGLSGVSLRYCARAPERVPVKMGYVYFQVIKSGCYWEQVTELKSLSLHVSSLFQSAKIELIMVDE